MPRGRACRLSDRRGSDAAGRGAGELVVVDGLHAGHPGAHVAAGLLHQAPAAGGQVVRHARRLEREPVVVDQVQVGAHARGDDAAVAQAVQRRGLRGLAVHHVLERQLRPAGAVAGPVREHERGHAAVADRAAVRAAVAEAHACVRVPGDRLGERQVAVAVVEERRVDHAVAVERRQLVEHHLHRRHALRAAGAPAMLSAGRARSRCCASSTHQMRSRLVEHRRLRRTRRRRARPR